MTGFDPNDSDSRDRLLELHDRLRTVLELPVERDASNWIGESEALVRDLVDRGASPEVRRKRLAKVKELLDEVEATGELQADEHVAAARRITAELLAESENSDDDARSPP